MKLVQIRKQHPFFYKRSMLIGSLFSYFSITMLFAFSKFNVTQNYAILRDLFALPFWGILYGISGFGTIFAANFLKEIWVRLFVALGVGVATMWAVGLFIFYLVSPEIGPLGFALFAFIAGSGYILVTDPLGEKRNAVS